MGGLFEIYQKITYIWISRAKMVHPQPTTPVATDNTAANTIVNGTSKQKISSSIDMKFYWVRDRIIQNHFQILCEEVKKILMDYFTKHHPIWHHRNMRPIFLKPTKKDIKKSKDRRTRTRQGSAGTSNPGVTWKPDNTLGGIRNIFPNVTHK